MSSVKDRYIRQMRVDDNTKAAIRSAARANNLTQADAIRWLLFQGAAYTGHWPDTAHLNVPPQARLHTMVDSRTEYIADGNGGDN